MFRKREKILIADNDPLISDLISKQALIPLGYETLVVQDATSAMQQAIQYSPDVIVARLALPGLSGKDLLVALSAQHVDTPVIVITEQGMENDVIQAFRLGAYDYLRTPIREAEVVATVERALKQVRERKERQVLTRKLQQSNQELEHHVRDLTTLNSIGKAVTSITDQRALFEKVVEGAISITEADTGWFLLRDESNNTFKLVAYKNLPNSFSKNFDKPWDDGLSNVVALSGETLAIEGESLTQFKISSLGKSALLIPIKIQKEVIGLITVIRKQQSSFNKNDQTLLEAVADYVSISLVNARLFNALEERAKYLQTVTETAVSGDKANQEFLQTLSRDLLAPLEVAKSYVDMLLLGDMGKLYSKQEDALRTVTDKLNGTITLVEQAITSFHQSFKPKRLITINLNDKARQTISRFRRIAHLNSLTFIPKLSDKPVLAYADTAQIDQVFDGLISNAIKFCAQEGKIIITVDETTDNMAHIAVENTGAGIDEQNLPHLFEPGFRSNTNMPIRFGGPGIELSAIYEIITSHGGKIWIENHLGESITFHFTLQSAERRDEEDTWTPIRTRKDDRVE
jgi:signal transduction histidine kinase/DNA-binding response OmpR family regulator